MSYRWGPEGPPPEAYSRVTNPERFAPLHAAALELLDRLTNDFEVERTEDYGLDVELEANELARPSVRLVPRNPDAAPIIVVFSAFPGLGARVGRWHREFFPTCGCDACDETADGEIERLSRMVENVTAGRFTEAVHASSDGSAWLSRALWSPKGSSSGQSRVEGGEANALLAEPRRSYQWSAWTRR